MRAYAGAPSARPRWYCGSRRWRDRAANRLGQVDENRASPASKFTIASARSGRFGVGARHHRAWRVGALTMQNEVEGDLGERRIQAARTLFLWVRKAVHFRDQAVARGEGEIVVQVFVAIDVDLRRQLSIARCGDEEVDVGRPPSVPAELVEQLLRRALRRAGISRRQNGAETVAALGIGLDAAGQIVFWLRRG